MFSECSLDKHEATSDQDSWDGTELADFVPAQQKGGTGIIHSEAAGLGKRSRSTNGMMETGKAMCMKYWIAQLHEMEAALFQESGVDSGSALLVG